MALFLPLFANYCGIIAKKKWTLEELAVSFWSFSTKSLLLTTRFSAYTVFQSLKKQRKWRSACTTIFSKMNFLHSFDTENRDK